MIPQLLLLNSTYIIYIFYMSFFIAHFAQKEINSTHWSCRCEELRNNRKIEKRSELLEN